MQPVHVTLDDQAIVTGRDLVERYGPGASLSAVVRRALAMMDEVWAAIGQDDVARAYEREQFARYAGNAQRQPPKVMPTEAECGEERPFDKIAAALAALDEDDLREILEF
jgi:Arc/MetJ-type ribon-helix-helix transcriptional regulator